MATCRTLLSTAALLVCTTTAFAQAPANDDCTTPTVAVIGVNSFDNTAATIDGIALNPVVCDMGLFGDEQIYKDVWYSFTPAADGAFDFRTANNGANPAVDSRIAIYDSAACPADPALVINCNDDINAALQSGFNHYLTGGTTYTVRLGVYAAITAGGPQDLVVTDLGPEPANDDCANATAASLGLNAFDTRGASTGTGLELDDMVCDMGTFGDDQIYNDVWFSFAPATTDFYEMFVINNGNADFDSRLAVYDQSTCPDDPANVIACNDNIGGGLSAGVQSVPLTMGSTYLIRVGTFNEQELDDPAALDIAIGSPPSMVPANDDCGNAAVASVGLTPFDSSQATDGAGLPLDPLVCDMGIFGDEQIYQDVWWTFTPATTGGYDIASINNGGLAFDSRIAIYDQASCPDDPANVIACNDDVNPAFEAGVSSVVLNAGTNYYIRIGSYGAGGSSAVPEQPAVLSIALITVPPANDDCANAEVLTAFGNYAYDSTIATTDGSDLAGFCDAGTLGDDQVYTDVWFEYTPAVGGCTYISTLGLVTYDSRIAVYDSSSCPDDPSTVIACSDDEVQPATAPFEAGLDVNLTAGSTYLIRVGSFGDMGVSGAGGAGSLSIMAGPVAAGNDMGLQPGAPGCGVVSPFTDFCNGDGGNQMGCTDCPCGNNAMPGTVGGCLNSAGTATRLAASGDTSLSLPSGDTTDLQFTATGSPPGATNVLLSGNAVAPQSMGNPCFGLNSGALAGDRDGLRCAVQVVARHGNRAANAMGEIMDASGPNRVWGGPAQPTAGIGVQSGFIAGQTRYFQITHRDDAMAVCMRGLNTSQAVEVTFTP